jgi:CBS domain-containing protein
MVEEFPVVSLESDALEAARLLASNRLPGLVVVDRYGYPHSILPASKVVRFVVPIYIQDDPSLAGVLNESVADRAADALAGKKVRCLLPIEAPELPSVQSDDTILEVAAVMARMSCPLVAVLDGDTLIGVITASRLLDFVLMPH